MSYKNNPKGFTLIELLVVIAIIGLLAAIVSVAVSSARKKARDATRAATVKQVKTALELYYDKYGYYPKLGCSGWAPFVTLLQNENLITNLSLPSGTWAHWCDGSNGLTFIFMMRFEDSSNPILQSDSDGIFWGANCADPMYCLIIVNGRETIIN